MRRIEPIARIFSGVDLIIRGIRRIREIRVSHFDVQHPSTSTENHETEQHSMGCTTRRIWV